MEKRRPGRRMLDASDDDDDGAPVSAKRRVIRKGNGDLTIQVSGPLGSKRQLKSATVDLEHYILSEEDEEELSRLERLLSPSPSDASTYKTAPITNEAARREAFEEGLTLVMQLEEAYKVHRQEAITKMRFSTPLSVLHDMADEYGIHVHFETHELRFPNETTRFLVELFVGSRKGYGEAQTKKLAAHMAAAHLLRRLDASGYEIQPYYLIPGCRINPRIFSDLEALCGLLAVEQPFYVLQPKDPELKDAPLYTIKCQIGAMIAIGENDCLSLARRLAAKHAFEMLSGQDVPMEFICSGLACMSLIQAKVTPAASDTKKHLVKYRVAAHGEELKRSARKEAPKRHTARRKLKYDMNAEFDDDDLD